MIESFASKEAEKIFHGEVSTKLPIEIQRAARRKLLYLDEAENLQDVRVLRGGRSITVDTAMRLARYFGTSAAVWLRLQVRYDLESAEDALGPRIEREVKVLHPPAAS